MTDISVIVEGGMVRAVYAAGVLIEDAEVFDFDILEGGDEEELQDLLERIDESPRGTKLRRDLLTWKPSVQRALSYGDGLGA